MVIDTMVFVYALLDVAKFGDDATAVLDRVVGSASAPDSIRAELLNVFWQYVAFGKLDIAAAKRALIDAQRMLAEVVPVDDLLERALELACERNHPPYDTLFAALAERKRTKVVTYDVRFLKKFPDLTTSVAEFLGSRA